MAFPVQCTWSVPDILSHVLTTDPFSSYPLLHCKRQTLPNILLHTPVSSFPLTGGKSSWHRRTNKETKHSNLLTYYRTDQYKSKNVCTTLFFNRNQNFRNSFYYQPLWKPFFFSALHLTSNKLYLPWTLTLKWQNFVFCDGSTAVKVTVWLPSVNSCGDVTAGDAETVARSLSVALTGSQDTMAVVLPLSA